MDLDTPSQLAKLRLTALLTLCLRGLPPELDGLESIRLSVLDTGPRVGLVLATVSWGRSRGPGRAKASRRRTRGSRRSSSRSARRRPSARCYWAQKRLRIALPVPVRLQLVFELPTALAADVSFVVVRPPILSAVEVRIEDSVA